LGPRDGIQSLHFLDDDLEDGYEEFNDEMPTRKNGEERRLALGSTHLTLKTKTTPSIQRKRRRMEIH
jgi:hypothetical protein